MDKDYCGIVQVDDSFTQQAGFADEEVERGEEIERDIRIAIWNAAMKGGMGQDLSQAFIRRAMEEPRMKRAIAALSAVHLSLPGELVELCEKAQRGALTADEASFAPILAWNYVRSLLQKKGSER